MLGTLLTIAFMCPSLDRGVCNASSLSHVKAYIQLVPVSISSESLCAASPREWWQAWYGCTHTATRPNTLSPLTVLSSAIRRNAMLCLGFSTSLHAPVRERACSSDSVIALTWNCDEGRDCVTPTPLELMVPIGQHPGRSVCSHSLLLLSVIKENQPIRRQ